MKTNHAMKLTGILLLGVMLASACTQTYSQTPLGTPTLIPTGLFVSPFPSGQDPLQIIAELGTQTAQAQTSVASGTTVAVTGTPGTPGTGVVATDTPAVGTVATGATQNATLLPVTVVPGGSTFTPTVQGGSTVVVPTLSGTTVAATVGPLPSTYTLQKGEWPYCIARRYNVNPQELLSASGLAADMGDIFQPGLVLTIPQTGDTFPSPRALNTHPATYVVPSSDTTLNGVACYYGDIMPQAIATANNISVSAVLTAGQQLTIP